MSGFHLRTMELGDREEVARLVFHSTNGYYRSIGREPIFQGDDLAAVDIFDVYQQTDPREGLVAVDDGTNQIIGSCFVHPRETHVSLGIMNAHHEHFGRGVARAILKQIISDAQQADKPVRLVSSCFNLDSYSLYTRAGFVPFCTFQDMLLQVPDSGLPPLTTDAVVRAATLDDVSYLSALEHEISRISRENDYRYFINNPDGFWHMSVVESDRGLEGYLVSCCSGAMNMLGPGVARTQSQAVALLHAELNQQAGRCPVLLVPVYCSEVVQQLYAWGARNCEMHVAQSHGPAQPPMGVVLPTFLPESG